ncbi:aminoglycoside phosphotransferase family protein [Kibdelosporangium philippinense]|uniref:Aminoglycoside phosphotransferase family protein n=1 Tax=Kibdelosporangium philippinense TaxID=211113 RepID=A0ABS8ZL73_9PSEU|nr:aminoglycoside phosphotransferase family protein [Kibdelosporangium philippinense]MCE7008480.1 aminoglycoside phosphotransferase family protein [Kibdelosporangium philippinense]
MTKRVLSSEELNSVLKTCGIDPAEVQVREQLSEGMYNTAYRIRTAEAGYILKLAPDPASPSLTYERGLMNTEALFYREAADLPVPQVVYAEPEYLLMTEMPGTPWHPQKLDPSLTEKLRTELGTIVARLHRITGPGFGYPQMGLADSWRSAFRTMVTAVLDDAARYFVELPVSTQKLSDALDSPAFNEVTTPVLVHFDLWKGNILIDNVRITALIDGERAFWGDPLAEMVSLALYGDIRTDKAFLAGYGPLEFTDAASFRLAFYQVYLYMIMLVEMVPRESYDRAFHKLVTKNLLEAAAKL